MFTFVVVFACVGALLVSLSFPLIKKMIKPNSVYGLRVPATLKDTWVWYQANAKSGRDLLILGLVQIAMAFSTHYIWELTESTYLFFNIGLLSAGALICVTVGWIRAERLLTQRLQRLRDRSQ